MLAKRPKRGLAARVLHQVANAVVNAPDKWKAILGNLNLVLKLSGVQRLGFMKIRPNLITLPDG